MNSGPSRNSHISPKADFLAELTSLYFLPPDLTRIVVEYSQNREWESKAFTSWSNKEYPSGSMTYQNQLYICDPNSVTIYDHKGKIVDKHTISSPFAIDLDENKSLIYQTFINNNLLPFKLAVQAQSGGQQRLPLGILEYCCKD